MPLSRAGLRLLCVAVAIAVVLLLRVASGQASVIGDDSRVPVTDTAAAPFSAVVQLQILDDDMALAATCTGTRIGPDAVLTAAHCLYRDGNWSRHVRVVPGRAGDAEPLGAVLATDWWVPDSFIDTGDPLADWGLLRIPPGTIGGSWLELAALDDATLGDPGFAPAIAGYPTDTHGDGMWSASEDAFTVVGVQTLEYEIDTGPGESGAAIWSSRSGTPEYGEVVGIHTGGGDAGGPNAGLRITPDVLAQLRAGCQEIGCTIAIGGSSGLPFHAVAIGLVQSGP